MPLPRNRCKLWLLLTAALSITSFRVQAQIVPDATLEAESSSLILNQLVHGETADLIGGGAVRDNNLFHSFSEFNVNDSQQIYFVNPVDVKSILTK